MIDAAVVTGWAITGALTLAAAAMARRSHRAFGNAWESAAREAGLHDIRRVAWLGWPVHVVGSRGPLRVKISGFTAGGPGNMGTQVAIEGLEPDLSIGVEDTTRVVRALAGADLAVGDHHFDRRLRVTGRPDVASAVLTKAARDQVEHVFATLLSPWGSGRASPGASVSLGRGRLVARAALGDHPEWIAAFVRDLAVLAEMLLPVDDVPTRLLANLGDEPLATVRRAVLRVLVQEHPRHAATREALRVASMDPDDDVQVDAAIALGGPAGRDALLAIATREAAVDDASARAVRELGRAFPVDEACATIERERDRGRPRTVEACLEAIVRGEPEHAALVADVLAREDGTIAVAATRALGRIGALPAIAVLRDAEVRLAGNAPLRAAVRDAVAAIRGRLVGAEAGQVSMAVEEQGRVSHAHDAGRLTLPPGTDEP